MPTGLWGTGWSDSCVLISHAIFGYLPIFRIYYVEFTFTKKAKKGCEIFIQCPLERCRLRVVSPSNRVRRSFLIAFWDTWSDLKGGNCFCQEVDDHVVEVSRGRCGFPGCFWCFLQPSPASQLLRQPLEVLILTSAPAAEHSAGECVQQLT